eukprot:15431850-Alexandrium_andersonii.AAC.1
MPGIGCPVLEAGLSGHGAHAVCQAPGEMGNAFGLVPVVARLCARFSTRWLEACFSSKLWPYRYF